MIFLIRTEVRNNYENDIDAIYGKYGVSMTEDLPIVKETNQ